MFLRGHGPFGEVVLVLLEGLYMTLLRHFAHLTSTNLGLLDIHSMFLSRITRDLEDGDASPGRVTRWSGSRSVVCVLSAAATGVVDDSHTHLVKLMCQERCTSR